MRSASGLPAGARNYLTAAGARRWRARVAEWRRAPKRHADEIRELEELLESATVVEVREPPPEGVAFGARVTVRFEDGTVEAFRIVGVDELAFFTDAVSWISPVGKALLGADLGDSVTLEGEECRVGTIEKIEYQAG